MSDCIFCATAAGRLPAHMVRADEHTAAFLDTRPVFKGHVLVVPRQHWATLTDVPADLVGPLFAEVRQISAAVQAGLDAQGSFVGLNNTVSQSVPHLHVHVIPRTRGDGLRGFFWPRTTYGSSAEAEGYAAKIRDALEGGTLP